MSLEEVESFLIQKTLARCGQNVSQAALALGLSRGALYRRLEKFGIDTHASRGGATRPA
jgi:DNA-binding NtrC family response regulator